MGDKVAKLALYVNKEAMRERGSPMPKIVDHAVRRRELAEAAWRVIVKHGLEGTTTRLIAKESGYWAGVLAHYFESKDEILVEALRISHDGLDRRIREAVDDKDGLDALRTFCIEILPISPVSVRETHLEMSMWSRALVNKDLHSVQRSESSRWRRFMEGLIVRAQRSGRPCRDASADDLSRTLRRHRRP